MFYVFDTRETIPKKRNYGIVHGNSECWELSTKVLAKILVCDFVVMNLSLPICDKFQTQSAKVLPLPHQEDSNDSSQHLNNLSFTMD